MDNLLEKLGLRPDQLQKVQYRAGDLIFADGDRADCAFIIESGVVEISKLSGGVPQTLALLKHGSIFGELALVSRNNRSATAKAAVDTVCYAMDRGQFEAMMKELPKFPRFVLGEVIRSLRRLTAIFTANDAG